MIFFFECNSKKIIAAGTTEKLPEKDIEKLLWLFGEAKLLTEDHLHGSFIGPRKEMITPWSTNAVEITQNMGIQGIKRIEEFQFSSSDKPDYDPMLQKLYRDLDQSIFTIEKSPDPVLYIDDIR